MKKICLVKKAGIICALAAAVGMFPGTAAPVSAEAADEELTEMHRLYNMSSGEHFYTGSQTERDFLMDAGWAYEGIGWVAPASSSKPVYRLYNGNAGDHHYTLSAGERDMLVKAGWNDEGICWYSDEKERIPLYRQYNPNAQAGAHNYTTNLAENNQLVSVGWKEEGIGWYAVYGGGKVPNYTESVPMAALQLEGAPSQGGLQTFGDFSFDEASPSGDTFRKYEASIQSRINYFESQGKNVGIIAMDVQTGKGICYYPDSVFFTASSIKGIFCSSIVKYANAMATDRDLIYLTIHNSDNDAYGALFAKYGVGYTKRWFDECRAGTYPDKWTFITARDMAKCWVQIAKLLKENPDYTSFFNGTQKRGWQDMHPDPAYNVRTVGGCVIDPPSGRTLVYAVLTNGANDLFQEQANGIVDDIDHMAKDIWAQGNVEYDMTVSEELRVGN
ncbi:MAG: hypothetical protein Q4B22_08165 [Eubacteriales bacterium]|nr:hypothetical protein [Eubacteriales bacterium]